MRMLFFVLICASLYGSEKDSRFPTPFFLLKYVSGSERDNRFSKPYVLVDISKVPLNYILLIEKRKPRIKEVFIYDTQATVDHNSDGKKVELIDSANRTSACPLAVENKDLLKSSVLLGKRSEKKSVPRKRSKTVDYWS